LTVSCAKVYVRNKNATISFLHSSIYRSTVCVMLQLC
jgi:hypothetical protein